VKKTNAADPVLQYFVDFAPVPAATPGEYWFKPPPPFVLPDRYVEAYRQHQMRVEEIAFAVARPVRVVRDAIRRQLGYLYPAGRARWFSARRIPRQFIRAYKRRRMSTRQIAEALALIGLRVSPGMVLRAMSRAGIPVGKNRPRAKEKA
jgi:hypothetical protein